MKAPYNETAQAFFVNANGTIGGPVGFPFPCRVVAAAEIADEGGISPGQWTYMTCSRLFVTPHITYTSGSSVVLADYVNCAAVTLTSRPSPVWLCYQGQLVTPFGQPSYYRWFLAPYPF